MRVAALAAVALLASCTPAERLQNAQAQFVVNWVHNCGQPVLVEQQGPNRLTITCEVRK